MFLSMNGSWSAVSRPAILTVTTLINCKFVRNVNSQPYSSLAEILLVWSSYLGFNKPSGWFKFSGCSVVCCSWHRFIDECSVKLYRLILNIRNPFSVTQGSDSEIHWDSFFILFIFSQWVHRVFYWLGIIIPAMVWVG